MATEPENRKVSTDPYKGVRDFYPEDMYVQNYIFSIMRKAVESFGYEEYTASILEPAELYKSKTSEEIVNEQTYSFKDRGDREVTLRPEMTPTVARMVAGKRRELAFPLRWYSIPNVFRYEKPQRGRLREHFQLNVDLFGIESLWGEVEIISLAHSLLKAFGAKDDAFIIKINNRKILNYLFDEVFKISKTDARTLTRLIDKKNKVPAEEFQSKVEAILGEQTFLFLNIMTAENVESFKKVVENSISRDILGIKETEEIMSHLEGLGITNVVLDLTLARGFDYYTGIVFEIFDTHDDNNRSVFGGGRYDDLLSVFGTDKVPAIGFGMGDVTTRDFLETHELLPEYLSKTDLVLCVIEEKAVEFALHLAADLRDEGINVAVDTSGRKIGQQIKAADDHHVAYIIAIGEEEMAHKVYTLKELGSGTETSHKTEHAIAEEIKAHA
jgi:histidyl-tRNA synthetase